MRTKLILASGSPRRKEILEGIGVNFRVLVAGTDESCTIPEPAAYAEELARRKGQAIWSMVKQRLKEGIDDTDAVILSADTVVATDHEILGKPRDREDAIRMIRSLSGDTHVVVTGIGLTVGGVTYTAHCDTVVSVSEIPEEEILRYVDSGEPMDKAGGYGIQGSFSRWIEGINGCYFNVVGLPVHTLNRLFFECTGEYLG
ncbi:MAG: septum formation protein Maf [Clostridia bacterium]|nr:septum formation protein Maf [Clostridia bacterium]